MNNGGTGANKVNRRTRPGNANDVVFAPHDRSTQLDRVNTIGIGVADGLWIGLV
jgi:hypothetical protein